MARSGPTNSIAFITEAKREQAIELAEKGHAITFISLAIGLATTTLPRVIRHIEEELLFADFATLRSDDQIAVTWYRRFAEARAKEGMALETKIATGGVEWKRDAWLLERRHSYAYGSQNKLEVSGPEGGPVNVSAAIIQLPARDLAPQCWPADGVPEEPSE